MAHDGLSNAHPLWWGVPLVLTLGYLVIFTAYECYTDFTELHQPASNNSRDEDAEEPGADEASADGENALPPPGDEALISSDDADAEAGRAPEEYKDEEQAVSRLPASEQIQFDVMGMMLCNYKDEAGAAGKSTTAEMSAEGPPGPPPLQQHF